MLLMLLVVSLAVCTYSTSVCHLFWDPIYKNWSGDVWGWAKILGVLNPLVHCHWV